jgi:threonine dehydrogenase-like Zn-dependent dehydrogenase
MKALLITGPERAEIADVPEPVAAPGTVVASVSAAGICGTDLALFAGDPARLAHTLSTFPLRLGHEWSGTVTAVGDGVDPDWLGQRVTADTILGCGSCRACAAGRHQLCVDRREIGVRGGWAGALAERLLVPEVALRRLPEEVDDIAGAMVEPGANAWRAVDALHLTSGMRALVIGPGTIGLLALQFARSAGAEVHVLGVDQNSLDVARSLGAAGGWTDRDLPQSEWDAVLDASDASGSPSRAAELIAPGGRISLVGVSTELSSIDSRQLVRREISVQGIMGGSAGLQPTIDAYARGDVRPASLVRAVLSLEHLRDWLNGSRYLAPGTGTKILARP